MKYWNKEWKNFSNEKSYFYKNKIAKSNSSQCKNIFREKRWKKASFVGFRFRRFLISLPLKINKYLFSKTYVVIIIEWRTTQPYFNYIILEGSSHLPTLVKPLPHAIILCENRGLNWLYMCIHFSALQTLFTKYCAMS